MGAFWLSVGYPQLLFQYKTEMAGPIAHRFGFLVCLIVNGLSWLIARSARPLRTGAAVPGYSGFADWLPLMPLGNPFEEPGDSCAESL
jgi:hypothetical protein